VWATDISADALDVATANMAGAGMAARRVTALQGDWWGALPPELRHTFDLVVSNPPYVSDDDPLPPEVEDYEPKIALRAGQNGMDAIRRIVQDAPEWITPRGVLVVELDPRQAEAAAALARENQAVRTEIKADALGRDRALVAQW
jgi:release factor glutamine methyltransferase